ncbi:MAG: hypothetical protein EBT03_10980 [Betaproteobacteria bacterium]|nr:hypothetical protein [Betaproteobacteria bacterium]
MNRRSACICFLVFFKASVTLAAQTVSRIAGPRWNVNGDWTPSVEEVQRHLRDAHGINPGGLGLEDLLNLHDNDHNRRGHAATHSHRKASKGSAKGYAKH